MKGKQKEGRVYDKRQACIYCGTLVSKLSSHLLHRHSDEREVAELKETDPKPTDNQETAEEKKQKRKQQYELIRNRGNFYHNQEVLKQGGSNIILVRRPLRKEQDNASYGPCPDCLGFYLTADLWRHHHYRCVKKDERQRGKNEVTMESNSLKGEDNQMNESLKEVFVKMARDSVTLTAKNDLLIQELGKQWLLQTFWMKSSPKRYNFVSQKMREVARLLQILRSFGDASAPMATFLKPGSFDTVVKGVVEAAKWSGTEYKIPSLALKLGHSVRRLAQIKKAQATRRQNQLEREDADFFLQPLDSEWQQQVSKIAHFNLYNRTGLTK